MRRAKVEAGPVIIFIAGPELRDYDTPQYAALVPASVLIFIIGSELSVITDVKFPEAENLNRC